MVTRREEDETALANGGSADSCRFDADGSPNGKIPKGPMSMTTGQVREQSEGASAHVEGLLRFRAYRTGRGKKSRGAGDKKENTIAVMAAR